MQPVHLRTSLETAFVEDGFYELSFFGENGFSVEEILAVAALLNAQIRTSTVGRIRSVGLEPFRSPPPPLHLTVMFRANPTDDELEALIGTFDRPISNPSPGE
jgi:hypothetical protein